MASCVYLDYNATTPIESEVIEEINRSLHEDWGNVSSQYPLGMTARSVVEESRRNVARMINASPEDIIFTSGGTEANNVALTSAVKVAEKLFKGKLKPHVITSSVEHDSIIKVLRDLQNKGIIELSIADVNIFGAVEIDSIFSLICENTCLITIMHANNETGVLMPIEEMGHKLKNINATRLEKNLIPISFHTDAAQTIGKICVDVEDLKVDFLTIVGHKFYAPRIGALYARDVVQKQNVFPIIFGGGQERGLRPGTENTAMIAGLGLASKLVVNNLEVYRKKMKESRDYFQRSLKEKVENISFNFSESDRLPNTLSVAVPNGSNAADILKKCENQFSASLGAACHSGQGKSSAILIASGLSEEEAGRTIRFSVGRSTSKEELDSVVESIVKCI